MVGSINGNSYQSTMFTQMTQKMFNIMDSGGDQSGFQAKVQNATSRESSGLDDLFSSSGSSGSTAASLQNFASALSQIFMEMQNSTSGEESNAGAPPPPPPPDSSQMISDMDTDGDGYLSVDELSAGGVKDAEKLFSEIDTDGDGLASSDELNAFAQTMAANGAPGMAPPPPPPPDSSQMISDMDTDGDGYLSVDELSAGGVKDAEKLFSEIDTDGDGLASQDELDTFAETMAAEGPQPPPSGGMSENTNSLQMEFLNKLLDMISQNKGYMDFNSSAGGTSIFA